MKVGFTLGIFFSETTVCIKDAKVFKESVKRQNELGGILSDRKMTLENNGQVLNF